MVFQVSERHVNRNLDPADASGFEKKKKMNSVAMRISSKFMGTLLFQRYSNGSNISMCILLERLTFPHTQSKHLINTRIKWIDLVFVFHQRKRNIFFSLCSVDCLQNYNQTQRLANEMNGPSWKSIHSITVSQ